MKKSILSLLIGVLLVSCIGSYYYGSSKSKEVVNAQVINNNQVVSLNNDTNEFVCMVMLNSLSNNIRLSEKNNRIITNFYDKNERKGESNLSDMDNQVNQAIKLYNNYLKDGQDLDKALCIESCQATLNDKIIEQKI